MLPSQNKLNVLNITTEQYYYNIINYNINITAKKKKLNLRLNYYIVYYRQFLVSNSLIFILLLIILTFYTRLRTQRYATVLFSIVTIVSRFLVYRW